MASAQVARRFAALGGEAVLRAGVVTDNGAASLDVRGLAISDPLDDGAEINQWPGVVTVGIFARHRASVCLLGTAAGVKTLFGAPREAARRKRVTLAACREYEITPEGRRMAKPNYSFEKRQRKKKKKEDKARARRRTERRCRGQRWMPRAKAPRRRRRGHFPQPAQPVELSPQAQARREAPGRQRPSGSRPPVRRAGHQAASRRAPPAPTSRCRAAERGEHEQPSARQQPRLSAEPTPAAACIRHRADQRQAAIGAVQRQPTRPCSVDASGSGDRAGRRQLGEVLLVVARRTAASRSSALRVV